MRKVIEISTCGVANTNETQCSFITTVLCDDGTMWEQRGNSKEWHELPSVPQPEEQK